jgi:metal-sulfur cluster biosynthetic enzyme
MMTQREEILEALKKVEDPEMGVNIVDLGLVYGLAWDEASGKVSVELTLTSPGCPLGPEIMRNIKRELQALDDVIEAEVALVWRPLWNPAMMSDEAKEELGYDEEYGLGLAYY